MTTLINEVETGLGKLRDFYAARAAYIQTGSSPEDHATIVDELGFDNLHTYSYDASIRGAGFPVGVSSETLAEYSAVIRELDMASQSKSVLYGNISAEAQTESQEYDRNLTYSVGVLRGARTTGPEV